MGTCTLNLLQGTATAPAGAVLVLENGASIDPMTFARGPTFLLQQPGAEGIGGLALSRFQSSSGVAPKHLQEIVPRGQYARHRNRGRPRPTIHCEGFPTVALTRSAVVRTALR